MIKPEELKKLKEEANKVPLTALGSAREFAANNNMHFCRKVQESKSGKLPTMYFKSNNNVTGIVLSQKLGAKYPVGTEVDVDNVFVNERTIPNANTGVMEKGFILTSGNENIVWES